MMLHGNAPGGGLADPTARREAEHGRAVIADAGIEIGVEGLGRRRRDDVDPARERARAECRSLRSAQHFDLLDIEQHRRARDSADVETVDAQADRGVVLRVDELLEIADAANLHEAAARRSARHRYVGGRADDGFQVLSLARLDEPCVDDRRAADTVGERLGPEARRHDDLVGFDRRLLGLSPHAGAQAITRHAERGDRWENVHSYPHCRLRVTGNAVGYEILLKSVPSPALPGSGSKGHRRSSPKSQAARATPRLR